jgi:hypothetical protein
MRVPVVVLLCIAVLSASVATVAETVPTITVYAEPPELEIWVDGERIGVGEAVLFGPFEDYVEVTVKGEGYEDTGKVIRSSGGDEGNLVIVIAGEKKRGFSWKALGIGLAVVLGPFCLIFAGGL